MLSRHSFVGIAHLHVNKRIHIINARRRLQLADNIFVHRDPRGIAVQVQRRRHLNGPGGKLCELAGILIDGGDGVVVNGVLERQPAVIEFALKTLVRNVRRARIILRKFVRTLERRLDGNDLHFCGSIRIGVGRCGDVRTTCLMHRHDALAGIRRNRCRLLVVRRPTDPVIERIRRRSVAVQPQRVGAFLIEIH